ncbi:hypothetical protein V1289_004719 [Bradyrhizobium sp. AZCC 2289]
MPPLNLYARVRFFAQPCTRDRGCSAHPAFPAPSDYSGRETRGSTRANRAAGMRRCVFNRHPEVRAKRASKDEPRGYILRDGASRLLRMRSPIPGPGFRTLMVRSALLRASRTMRPGRCPSSGRLSSYPAASDIPAPCSACAICATISGLMVAACVMGSMWPAPVRCRISAPPMPVMSRPTMRWVR